MITAWVGYVAIAVFVISYILVIFEEKIHLRKSKPVLLAGTLIWMFIGIYMALNPGASDHLPEEAVKHLVIEIGELFFFLFAAMTYINALAERNVFEALRTWLLRKNMSYRALFLATGGITFLLSPIADNLTSALLMATVASAVGGTNKKFISLAFVNIIVAANAGGAWSPFGDITTLMVWTAGRVETTQFAHLIIPSILNWLIVAACMYPFVPKEVPSGDVEKVAMKVGAKRIIFLGVLTIATAVSFHQFLHLPPFMGMMLGLGLLMALSWRLKTTDTNSDHSKRFDIFRKIEKVEFDTLLFFFGVIMGVGGLQYIGYLALAGNYSYGLLGNTTSNILVGLVSAIVDNIPVMFAVLQMGPEMGLDQWLLVTLTAGVGGSLLSVGSAAGVAVMGVRRDAYTFMTHLKWTPVIGLAYAVSIGAWYLTTGSLR
jgi:Na+/H+ antiporter NhaD/arsenite permease-like protein